MTFGLVHSRRRVFRAVTKAAGFINSFAAQQELSGQVHSLLLFVVEHEEVRPCTDNAHIPNHVKGLCVSLFNKQMALVKHTGGCHCGAVRFEVQSSPDLHVFHCKYVHE